MQVGWISNRETAD